MGFFTRWASFLFKALGWAFFRDGLLFFLRPLGGLLSRWASFLFKALGWACFRDGLVFLLRPLGGFVFFLRRLGGLVFFLRPLDGLVFETTFAKHTGGGGLLFEMIDVNTMIIECF